MRFTTINDLAARIADSHGLDSTAVRTSIDRSLFGRYEDIGAVEYAALCRQVWTDLTGADYPADWGRQLDDDVTEETIQAQHEDEMAVGGGQ